MDLITSIYIVIIPPIITIGGNIFFYYYIKGSVDKSIEKHKIAYSGIFKERIEVYRELLRQIFEIRFNIEQYQYAETPQLNEKIVKDFKTFIDYCLMNQPFLSEKMVLELNKIREEFQSVYENLYKHHFISKTPGIDAGTLKESLKNFYAAINKIRGHDLKEIENTIINEMRTDLRINNL